MAEEVLTKELEAYKKAGANLLMPTTAISGLSEFHKPVIETVLLSANPEDGDVYAHDNADPSAKKKWRPTKQALMKLSVCAGVIWSPTESRRIDNQSDRNYIAYKAVGGIRKADGQPVFFSAEYDLDFEVIEEELRESYEAKAKNYQNKTAKEKAEYVDYCVKRDLLQKRKNKLKLCEAGAMNRVLRMLLGIKQAYTTAELAKPFVTARIVFRPDFNDKEVRSKLIDASIKSMMGVFGETAVARVPDRAEPIDVTPIDPSPEEPGGENGGDPDAGGKVYPLSTEKMMFEQPEDTGILDFQNSDVQGQVKTITDMAKQAQYDLEGWLKKMKKKTAADLSAEKRLELFKHLREKLEPKDVPEPEVPFD